MAISEKWKLKEAFETSWSVAQVNAPFSTVVSALAGSRKYRDSKQSGADAKFRVDNGDRWPLIVYSTASSDWTYLECVWGSIEFGPLVRLTKTAKTDLLVADYCDDPCGWGYGHFRNGRLVEEFSSVDPEWFESRGLDGKERKWVTNTSTTQRMFGKRDTVMDIEANGLEDWWNDVSESLSLDIPYRCWTDWVDDDHLGADATEVSDVTDAHLLIAIWAKAT